MIVCSGEALIDMIPVQTLAGEEGFVPYVGGAVFNTAIALGRLGEKAALFSGVSNDFFGEILVEGLLESHVQTDLLARSERPTTLAFVKLKGGQASYRFYDENTAGRMLAATDIPSLPSTTKAVFFGGISLAVEPCAEVYAEACARFSKQHLTMVDPNIRPTFITDADRYRARVYAMMEQADIVKLSDEDAQWLTGSDAIEACVQDILQSGSKLVLLTRGSEGALAYRAGQEPLKVPSEKVKLADTVGAGDTFNAGFLHALSGKGQLDKDALACLSDADLAHALSVGCKAAAVTVSRRGANPPWHHELDLGEGQPLPSGFKP